MSRRHDCHACVWGHAGKNGWKWHCTLVTSCRSCAAHWAPAVAVWGLSRSVPANIRECQQLSRRSWRKSLGSGQSTFNTITFRRVALPQSIAQLAAVSAAIGVGQHFGWHPLITSLFRVYLNPGLTYTLPRGAAQKMSESAGLDTVWLYPPSSLVKEVQDVFLRAVVNGAGYCLEDLLQTSADVDFNMRLVDKLAADLQCNAALRFLHCTFCAVSCFYPDDTFDVIKTHTGPTEYILFLVW